MSGVGKQSFSELMPPERLCRHGAIFDQAAKRFQMVTVSRARRRVGLARARAPTLAGLADLGTKTLNLSQHVGFVAHPQNLPHQHAGLNP